MLARLTGKSGGVEDLNIAEYPGPLGIHDPAQITKNIESDLIGKIVTGLTNGPIVDQLGINSGARADR